MIMFIVFSLDLNSILQSICYNKQKISQKVALDEVFMDTIFTL